MCYIAHSKSCCTVAMQKIYRKLHWLPLALLLVGLAVIFSDFRLLWLGLGDYLARTAPAETSVDHAYFRSAESLTIEQALQRTFAPTPINKAPSNYGLHQSWHQLIITNEATTATDFVLMLDNPMIDRLNVYEVQTARVSRIAELGDETPGLETEQRTKPHATFQLNPNDTLQVVISAETSGAPKLPIVLLTAEEFEQYVRVERMIWGSFIGIALLMAVYNLVLYMGVRDLSYLAYVGYAITVLIALGVVHGYNYYLFPEAFAQALSKHIIPVNALLAIVTLFFAQFFLRITQQDGAIYQQTKAIILFFSAFMVVSLFVSEHISAQAFAGVQLLFYVVAFRLISYKVKERFIWSKYYVLSWLPLFVGAAIGYLLFTGVVDYSFWTRHAFLFSAMLEMTLISMALADRLGNTEMQRLYQATHDMKFGFANDALLHKTITQLSKETPDPDLSLISIELTNYNQVSPYLTEPQLQTLMHHLARYLVNQLRKTLPLMVIDKKNPLNDTIALARGEVFSVLVSSKDSTLLHAALEQLTSLNNFNPIQGEIPFRVQCVFGASMFNAQDTNTWDLINHSKQAITQAKQRGISYFLYSPDSDLISARRIKLAQDLADAIRQDDLELHHQPQTIVMPSHIVASELLVRWKHPLYGMIAPDEFVRIAEETGLINHLTTWVMRRAMKHAQALTTFKMQDFHFSINVSALDMSHRGFAKNVKKMLKHTGMSASHFTFELTETTHSLDADTFNENLNKLRDLGICLAIDDFGTGYSSLTYASDHPFSELKIDKQFISDILTSEKHQAVVRATITMAKNLGLYVTAEGVEDAETYALLKDMGCDKLQGYFIAKPMPFADYLKWKSPNFHNPVSVGETHEILFDQD